MKHDVYYHVNGVGVSRGDQGCPVGWTAFTDGNSDKKCCDTALNLLGSCTGTTRGQWPYANAQSMTNLNVDRCIDVHPWSYNNGQMCCSSQWEDSAKTTPLTSTSTTCGSMGSLCVSPPCKDWGYVDNSFRVNPNQDTTTFTVTIEELANGVFAVSNDPNIAATTDYLNIGMKLQVTEDANILDPVLTGSTGFVS